MKEKISDTQKSWSPVFLRLFLGLVVFPHGAQKLLGWYGGYGFHGTMGYFTDTMGLPWVISFLVIFLEFFGAIALLIGLGTRLVAVSYVFLALGIIFTSHGQNGFFMNWMGNQAGEGYEYFLLWLGMAIALAISGGGKYSVDKLILTGEGA